MRIVPYDDARFGEVVALWDACGLNVPHNDPARDIALVQDSVNAALFLGLEDERAVGSIMVGHDGHRGWIYRLGIAPDRRKQGLARTLVRHAETWLRERRIRKAEVIIRPSHVEARDFYVRVGYGVEPRLLMARWLEGDSEGSARQIEVVITYLEMTQQPLRPTIPTPAGRLALMRVDTPSVGFYRYLYDTIGEPWFWTDRRRVDDDRLRAVIQDPKVETYVLYVNGEPGGYVELDRRPEPDIDFAYFGIMPHFVGRGFGPYLMNWAVDQAWQYGPKRLTVNTCTLDHPKAIRTYQRVGFVPYKQERKLMDDPRLAGLIPNHLEPRLP